MSIVHGHPVGITKPCACRRSEQSHDRS